MIQIGDSVPPTIKKIDGFFNDGRLALIKSNSNTAFYSIIKIVAMSCIACWAFPNSLDLAYSNVFILGILLNILELSVAVGIIYEAKDVESSISVAQEMEHCVQQPILQVNNYNTIQSRVSQKYDFLDLIQQREDDTTQRLAEVMEFSYSTRTCWISKVNVLCKVLGIVFIYLMIKTLLSHKASNPTKIVAIVCLVLQIISKLDILITLIIFTFLFPLVFFAIILCCIFSCCCADRLRALLPNSRLLRQQNQQFNIQNHPELQPIQFSATTILQTQNDCKICFQKFQLGDKLLILPCSNKHVFHEFCITIWFKASQTCPLCRKSLQQMVANPVIQ